ncbi:MAG: hypothetical protein E7352_02460 [Clostridiales bacterium]|nr:hypothetical protein [Clostridiales bacterium]
MRKRLKKAMLLLLAALATLLMLVGCELGMTPDQAKHAYDIKTTVTYYANGGEFGNSIKVQELWYKANVDRPMNIGVDKLQSGTTASFTLTRENYEFEGWYHIAIDEETGELLADAKTGECTLDMEKPVDFDTLLSEGEEWHIGAYWKTTAKVRVRLVADGKITDKAGNEYDPEADADIKTFNYVKKGLGTQTEMDVAKFKSPIDLPTLPTKMTHVFAGYYFDEDCTQPVTAELEMQPNQKDDVTIYAKYLTKDWAVVWNSKTAKSMFDGAFQPDKKYFVARDVVMSAGDPIAVTDLAATIDGNGRTIRGLTISNKTVPNGKDMAFLGNIQSTASIKDITFEDMNFTYGTLGKANFYFVCLGIANGASIENVTLSGMMSVSDNSAVNMEEGTASCMFGGFVNDAAYLSANPNGFKIKNMSLKYNTKEYVEIVKDFAILN